MINEIERCPLCSEGIGTVNVFGHRISFYNELKLRCLKCDWSSSFLTCKETILRQEVEGDSFQRLMYVQLLHWEK